MSDPVAAFQTAAEALPPYNVDTRCIKCASFGPASTHYIEYGNCIHPDVSVGWHKNERLHRRCRNCDYQWDEAIVP